ncbi:glycoside hydrolase family 3 N-terminal domain-containing protein [Nocardioides sp. SOB77]|uniref:beta-N-acetylhexosaminidase n=1 Tax=Nocardioides oceani TaxID=3058369 RepID=A0ABT8FEP8_9ACTN|nr:glycoside hydrolase family 3 N-terminal domain-containing protein [Nocardioides oceani]MDN4173136.1 glycoside hydrolase family 3 N-terminal domain-containing protein [Nocardioides oceani]
MPARPRRTARALVAAVAAVGLVAGCTDDGGTPPGDRPGDRPAAEQAPPPSPSERLGLAPGWGPTRAELDRAARRVGRLRLPDLAGQLIVARYAGTRAPSELVRRLHLGGVVVFDENVAGPEALRGAMRTLQRDARRGWPLMTAVDQEGGLVERVGGAVTAYPAFMAAGAAGDRGLTRRAYRALGGELRRTGLNTDLAPVADVTSGPADPVIGSRSPGSSPAAVAAQSLAAARGLREAGLVPVVKHFPGHGSLTTDSHVALPVQTRSVAQLRRVDLAPFAAAVEAGLPAVMVGHIAVQAVDPGVPATLSRPVVHGMLRERLGFGGLVVSDALEMAAVRGRPEPAVRFLAAGGDVVLMPADPAAARASIVRAVRQDRLPRRRLEQAAARMVALLEHQAATGGGGAAPGSAAGAARRLSAAAVTVVAGPCSGPLSSEPVVPLGSSGSVAAFRSAAGAAGLALGSVRYVKPPRPERTGNRRKDRRRLAAWRRIEPRQVVEGTPVHLIGPGGTAPDDGIVVATDRPWVLGTSTAPVRVATYGSGPSAMGALVAVLTGEARAPGRLPVQVSGVERPGC